MKNDQIILVKSDSTYQGLNDLAGKIVGVQADSSAEVALNENPDFKDTLQEVVQIDDYSKAVMEIQNGTIDAIAIDEVVARYYLQNNPGAYTILQDENGDDASLAEENYVIGFRKGRRRFEGKSRGRFERDVGRRHVGGNLQQVVRGRRHNDSGGGIRSNFHEKG